MGFEDEVEQSPTLPRAAAGREFARSGGVLVEDMEGRQGDVEISSSCTLCKIKHLIDFKEN